MKPIDKIPDELLSKFTLNNRIPVEYHYDDATTSEFYEQIEKNFTRETLIAAMDHCLRCGVNYYGQTDIYLYEALSQYPIFGQNLALIGSTFPWYEAVLLTRVPNYITVIEYGKRSLNNIPNLQYITPDLVENHMENYGKFDAAISISSYEHDGLGRYGDPIDPDGDLKAMKNLKKIIKPGGLLYLAIPIGKDKLIFNLHRVYGVFRLPLLLEEWELVGTVGYDSSQLNVDHKGDYQPIFILRNK